MTDPIAWVFLGCAIVAEVSASLSLKAAGSGHRRLYVVVVVGYLSAFAFLSLTLHAGLPLGVAYGVWAALGVALTALLCQPLFGEPITRTMWFGMLLIAVGVLVVELGTPHTYVTTGLSG